MSLKPPRPAGRLFLRGALGLVVLAALAAAGHALLWRWMGSQLEAGFAGWAAQRRALGWRVEHAPPLRGGWPFAATLTLPQFRLAGGAGTLPGGMEWQAEALVLRLAPPRLDRLTVEMPGRHRLRLGALDLPFAADLLTATMPLERGVLPSEARLEAERLRLGTPGGAVEARSAQAGIETRMSAIEGEPAVSLRLSAEGVLLPPVAGPAAAALGRAVETAVLDLALTGPVPPGRGPAAKAEAWRDGGGTLELRGLELRWGPVAGTATATLTLDEALQPMGAGTLRVTGAGEALGAAASAGLLTRQAAATGRTVLRLLSRAPAEGGPPQLEVPLALEDRVLTAARVPLATLPAWSWPAPPALPDAAQDPSLPARD
ncbi:DUF2125 domain-containing protein [Paracraurococcus lichenis]|uniref:DUF2125 domain-containing protein n=1 Tax=Paracraurococcus lichenis TaxID=3064888 RepID=A0ABT9DYG8_9PROT|nr:DUF2125 domain-containing protein [Paracraurococcus sp. LOR1-02]MDO9708946.1 DUF2125 domain-containing protein [Paracraurococcus sp. LOR1-02]